MYQDLRQSIAKLWLHLDFKKRKKFKFLVFLMVLSSILEVISVGAILPFLGVLLNPERVFNHPFSQPFIDLLGYTTPSDLLLPITILFGFSVVLAGTIRLLTLRFSTNLIFSTGSDISIDAYNRTLYQPYDVHINRNSSEIISGISAKVNNSIFGVLNPLVIFISSTIMLAMVITGLMLVNPYTTLGVFIGFGVLYFFIIWRVRKKLDKGGEVIARESTNIIKMMQEGIGGIRDVLIDGVQPLFCKMYANSDISLRKAQGNNQFISQSPRYIVEAISLTVLAIYIYFYTNQGNDIGAQIPVFGLIAFGAQKILPALQQSYGAWSEIKGNRSSLIDVIKLLEQPIPSHVNNKLGDLIEFYSSIKLEGVCFAYDSNSPPVLNSINLEILKGERVGFIGSTGSGKSSLLDVIMGLLTPTKGVLEIDKIRITSNNKKSWQSRIAHVPQFIFLSDSTVSENIAFGVPKDKIDYNLVKKVASQAKIDGFISALPDKFETIIGEGGVKFSGGQRQRIGIARALYKQSDVIIFDEATSALDTETEQKVMETIYSLGKDLTVLIVAHRLTTLESCDRIIELNNGSAIELDVIS